MNWKYLDELGKSQFKEDFLAKRKAIQQINSKKANLVKKGHIFSETEELEYRTQIEKLQEELNNTELYYLCDHCGVEFRLPFTKINDLARGKTNLIFCSLKCSGQHSAKRYYNNVSEEDKLKRNEKIRQAVISNISKLTKEDCEARRSKMKVGWSLKDKQEISQQNKLNNIKGKQTKLERYGNENYNNREQAKETWQQKYNDIDNKLKNQEHLSTEILQTIHDRQKLKHFIEQIPVKDRNYKLISDKLGISDSYCNTLILKYELDKELQIQKYVSRPELEVKKYISSIYTGRVIYNTRDVISPKELDIYIPDRQLAIEVNGAYYHREDLLGKTYHYDKSKACEELGIRLIHIFDYEWQNERQQPILKNIIANALNVNSDKVYARNTEIVVRPSKEVKEFFDKNNIQGFRGGKFAICLIDKRSKELLMSYIMGSCFFGKGKYEWEVIRGATKLGTTVVGGASKIWNYFIKTYNPSNCVYYVDYNYFNGNSLPHLGLEFITTQPGCKNYWFDHWKTHEKNVIKNREPENHKEVMQAFCEGKGFTIYNAGTKVYAWYNTKNYK